MMRSALLLLSLIVGTGSSNGETMHSHGRQQYFSSMDSNASGGVSVAEFQAWMAYSFNRIDKNSNNVIDADEALVPKMTGVPRSTLLVVAIVAVVAVVDAKMYCGDENCYDRE